MTPLVKFGLPALILIILMSYFLWPNNQNSNVVSDIKPRENAAEAAIKIIAFGDSLTAGFGLPASESYPAQLEVALRVQGQDVEVINSGVSGETTRGNLERAQFIRSQNPDIILVGIGGNDALRRLPLEDTKKNISETIEILQSGTNPPVVALLQMQSPLNAGLSYKREFDAIYPDLAQKNNTLLIPFLTTEIFLKAENKLSDGIHLNKLGYSRVVELYLVPTLTEVLEKLNQ